MQTKAQQQQKSTETKRKIKKVSKPPMNVWKISLLTKADRFGHSAQNCKQVRPASAPVRPLGTLHQNNCMLKTWSLRVKNAPNHHVNAQIQTPAKGAKIKKKEKKKTRGAIKKTKKRLQKSRWKCTHRAGVKCCNKNVNMAQNTVWRCEPECCAFSLDLCLQFCHVTHSAPTSSNESAASNSWCWMLS